MNEATFRDHIHAHAATVARGDMESLAADFSQRLRPRLPELAQALPQPTTAAEVLNIDVGERETVALIRYSGQNTQATFQSHWQDEGGRPVIVHAEPHAHPAANEDATARESTERFKRGWQRLMEIDGEAGHRVIDSLTDIAPDLGRYIVEFAFGDVYSRPGLDLRQRQLVTIAALTSLGATEPQLEVHINAALNVGLSRQEIVEAIIHCAPYAGFPRALNSMFVAKRRLAEGRPGSVGPD
jgi:4-carboxymuconolactone decarboxylase